MIIILTISDVNAQRRNGWVEFQHCHQGSRGKVPGWSFEFSFYYLVSTPTVTDLTVGRPVLEIVEYPKACWLHALGHQV